MWLRREENNQNCSLPCACGEVGVLPWVNEYIMEWPTLDKHEKAYMIWQASRNLVNLWKSGTNSGMFHSSWKSSVTCQMERSSSALFQSEIYKWNVPQPKPNHWHWANEWTSTIFSAFFRWSVKGLFPRCLCPPMERAKHYSSSSEAQIGSLQHVYLSNATWILEPEFKGYWRHISPNHGSWYDRSSSKQILELSLDF